MKQHSTISLDQVSVNEPLKLALFAPAYANGVTGKCGTTHERNQKGDEVDTRQPILFCRSDELLPSSVRLCVLSEDENESFLLFISQF